MRILILNNEYPPLGGGAGVCTRFHAEGLAKMGHQITILTAWYKGEKEFSESGNIQIIRLKSLRKSHFKSNPVEMLSWAYHAIQYIRKNVSNKQFDICLANYAMPAGIVANFAFRTKKIPYIVISHGEDIPFVHKERMLIYHLINYFALKRIFSNSVLNVVLSGYQKNIIDRFLGNNKSQIISNGCDPTIFKPDYTQTSKVFKILFIGRLQDVKSPMIFLKAIQLFSFKNIEFTVSILGDGPLRKKMENYVIQNQLTKNVHFKGWISKEEMIKEYQSAHVQVMTSRFEAFSISALESLFSGVYLLSTPVSGNTDMIKEGENGNLFPFKNINKLSDLLEEYYQTKFIHSYKIEVDLLNELKEKYAWQEVINQYNTLLNNL